jgi:hypothetical protein
MYRCCLMLASLVDHIPTQSNLIAVCVRFPADTYDYSGLRVSVSYEAGGGAVFAISAYVRRALKYYDEVRSMLTAGPSKTGPVNSLETFKQDPKPNSEPPSTSMYLSYIVTT